MAQGTGDITVVVSTYRRPEGLRRLLDALAKQTMPHDQFDVVVVENGSGAQVVAEVEAVAAASPLLVRVLRIETNRGPAGARNLGWRSTTTPYVAFTDDDCEPHPDWLAAGSAALDASERVGIVQGRTVRSTAAGDYHYTCFTVVREVLQPSPWFEGCNLFFRREAIEAAGGFDEGFGFFGEETSLGWSVVEAGWQRAWAEDAVVEHPLVERSWRWHLQFHYLERNIVRLAVRHPQIRTMFWRPWAVKRENALFALAAAGLVTASRQRSAVALTVPYLVWLFPPGHRPMGPQAAAQQISAHAAALAGKLAVGLKERTIVL
jgi:GT2 family glycosyltransferase